MTRAWSEAWGGRPGSALIRARSEEGPCCRRRSGPRALIRARPVDVDALVAELPWRSARLSPDDFCPRICDDGGLQLEFSLGAGRYATALLAELVRYRESLPRFIGHGSLSDSGIGSEQA